MEDDLVTIRNYAFGPDPAGEAELARIKLESAGIACFLAGREFASMYWLASGANRGVKLQVKRSDAGRALDVLGPEPAAPDQEPEPQAQADESVALLCPRCQSDEVVYERFSRRFFYLSMLLLGFPLLWGRRRYRCDHCGYTWKRPSPPKDRTDRDADRSEAEEGDRP
jgi:DNA-directed RNA polymerase subunit M/transcription elongation factor TFIIS